MSSVFRNDDDGDDGDDIFFFVIIIVVIIFWILGWVRVVLFSTYRSKYCDKSISF